MMRATAAALAGLAPVEEGLHPDGQRAPHRDRGLRPGGIGRSGQGGMGSRRPAPGRDLRRPILRRRGGAPREEDGGDEEKGRSSRAVHACSRCTPSTDSPAERLARRVSAAAGVPGHRRPGGAGPGAAGLLLAIVAAAAGCATAGGRADPPPPEAAAPTDTATEADTVAGPAARVVQPGAPGERTRQVDPGRQTDRPRRYSAADAAFMRGMVVHHAQALVMTALVPDRTDRPEIRLLAARIQASQEAEIAMMRRWLEARGLAPAGEPGDPPADHHRGEHAGMAAGMASPEELARLERARGAAFDRLFLELMIRHHEGALEMVAELAERGGRDPEVHMFAAHVDADQRAEIARMRSIQDEVSQ